MAFSFDINWNIDKYRSEYESEEHWNLKAKFINAHKTRYVEEELICLAQIFFNIEFMGCHYPAETMALIEELSKDVAREFRESRKNRLKRTLITASNAIKTKHKLIYNENMDIDDTYTMDDNESKRLKSSEPNCDPIRTFVEEHPNCVLFHHKENKCPVTIIKQLMTENNVSVQYHTPRPGSTWILLNGKSILCGRNRRHACTMLIKELQKYFFTIKKQTPFMACTKIIGIADLLKCSQIAEIVEVDSSNSSFKLLQSLGWSSNPLAGSNTDIEKSIAGIQHYGKLHEQIVKRLLIEYKMTNDLCDLVFSSKLRNEDLAIIKSVATRCKLIISTHGMSHESQLVISNNRTTQELLASLINTPNHLSSAMYEVIPPTRSSSNNENIESKCIKRQPIQHITATNTFEAKLQSNKDDGQNEDMDDVDMNTMDDDKKSGPLRNIEPNCDLIRLFSDEHPNLVLFHCKENMNPVVMVRNCMVQNNISVEFEASEIRGKWILLNGKRMVCGKTQRRVCDMLVKGLQKHLYTIKKKMKFMACTKIIEIGDLLKCSQIAEIAETDSNNSTFKLLQSLGWSSNRLVQSNTDVKKSITVDTKVDQSNLGIQHCGKLDEQMVERLLTEYKMSNDLCDLVFSSKLRTEDLDIIKSAARRCKLLISTFDKSGQSHLVISNYRTNQELLASLKNTTDPLSDALYEVIPPTRSSLNNENIESSTKSDSVKNCDDDNDDDDEGDPGNQPIQHVTGSNHIEAKLQSNKDDDQNEDMDIVDTNTTDDYKKSGQLRNIEPNCDPIRLFSDEHSNLVLLQRKEDMCPLSMVRKCMAQNRISVKFESDIRGRWILLNHKRMVCGKNKRHVCDMLIKGLQKHLYTIKKKTKFMACTKIIEIGDLLKCSQIAEIAETDSSNSTFKLLQSLGWSSNRLVQSNTDVKKSITVDQSNLGIQHCGKLDEQIVERLLKEYKMSNDLCDLVFSSKLRSEDLVIIKSAARRCKLLISTFGKSGQSQLVISNNRTIQDLLVSLKNTRDPLSDAMYEVIPPTRSSLNNENIESSTKIDSVEYCDDDNDDDDEGDPGNQPIQHVTGSNNFEAKLQSNKDNDQSEDMDIVDTNTMYDDKKSGRLRNIEPNCDPIRLFSDKHPNLVLFQRKENIRPLDMVRKCMAQNHISVKFETEIRGRWILLNHKRMVCGKNKPHVCDMLIKGLQKHLYTIKKKTKFMACTKIIEIGDLLKCSQIAEIAETDSSNSTFKLLQSLGWSSNRLVQSNTDVKKSITVDTKVDQSNLGIQHCGKLDEQIVERLLKEYKMSNDLCDLVFSSKLRSEDLVIIKSAAKKCKLLISTFGESGQYQLVISNNRTIQDLLVSLKNTTDPLSNAMYEVISPTRSSSNNEGIESIRTF